MPSEHPVVPLPGQAPNSARARCFPSQDAPPAPPDACYPLVTRHLRLTTAPSTAQSRHRATKGGRARGSSGTPMRGLSRGSTSDHAWHCAHDARTGIEQCAAGGAVVIRNTLGTNDLRNIDGAGSNGLNGLSGGVVREVGERPSRHRRGR